MTIAKHWKQPFAVALACLLLPLAAACGGDDSDTSETPEFNDDPTAIQGVSTLAPFPVTLPRSDAKTLTLDATPQRIISLSPGATEIIYALGAEAALVAVDTRSDYPAAAASITTRITPSAAAVDQIAALTPDLIIINQDESGLLAALDQRNLPVYFQDANTAITTIEQVLGQIALIGKATGKSDEAGALVGTLGARVESVEAAVQGLNSASGPRVFHELSNDFRTGAEGSLPGDLYNILRARNIAGSGGGSAYPQMTEDSVIASLPDVIILAHADATPDSVAARPGWEILPAVAQNKITSIDPPSAVRPGPRIVDALEIVAKAIYPDRFP